MAAKAKISPNTIVNRRAKFDYELGDELTVGIVLNGPEVRAARDNHVQLKGTYVTVKDNELWLINSSFSVKPSEPGGKGRSIDTRPRKLLAHRKQINDFINHKKIGLTIVPLRMLTGGRNIKLVIALGKGKKRYDKRQTIKRRDTERETQRKLRN